MEVDIYSAEEYADLALWTQTKRPKLLALNIKHDIVVSNPPRLYVRDELFLGGDAKISFYNYPIKETWWTDTLPIGIELECPFITIEQLKFADCEYRTAPVKIYGCLSLKINKCQFSDISTLRKNPIPNYNLVEATYNWYASGIEAHGVKDRITISDCIFRNIGFSSAWWSHSFYGSCGRYALIENNIFEDCQHSAAISAKHVDFIGNKVIARKVAARHPANSQVLVKPFGFNIPSTPTLIVDNKFYGDFSLIFGGQPCNGVYIDNIFESGTKYEVFAKDNTNGKEFDKFTLTGDIEMAEMPF